MVAAPPAARGLSTPELSAIREGLAAGRKPKVLFTEAAGQIAGQFGQVVALTDPDLADEWVVVRFGGDELPFSPTDLAVPPRAGRGRRPDPPPPPPTSREERPMATSDQTTPTASAPEAPAPRRGGTRRGSGGAPPDSPPPPAASPPAASPPAAPPPRAAGRAGRAGGRAKPPPALTVTVAYAEGEWTVAANQGSRALAKPYLIKPAEALKMVAMLDVPGVHEAVEQIVSAERARAEEQAQRLRAELAEIEARLAELRDAG
jgi:hypothetical protein